MGLSHPGFWRAFLLISFIAFVFIPLVSADLNYTPIFDPTDDLVHFNHSYTLDRGTQTPWDLWLYAGLIGLGLFLLSLWWSLNMTTPYIEGAAIVSVVGWAPIGFCAWASFNLDRVVGYGVTGLIESQSANGQINEHEYVILINHVLYQFPIIGVLMLAFLVVAILNTVRIIALHRVLKGQSETQ